MVRTIVVLVAMLSLPAIAKSPKKRVPQRRVEICGPIIKPRTQAEALVFLFERKPPELPDSLVTPPKRFTHDAW
jgi:hypothetical protein